MKVMVSNRKPLANRKIFDERTSFENPVMPCPRYK
jgi:hypothetical protein